MSVTKSSTLFINIFSINSRCLFFFKFYLKKTSTYSECSEFIKKFKSDEVLLDTYFRDHLEHFGASKDKLLFLFIVTNGACFFNNTSVFYLLSFFTSVYKGLALTLLLVLFLEAFILTTLELYVLFQLKYQISNIALLGFQRIAKHILAGVSNFYLFDKFCLGGDIDPPVMFLIVKKYQIFILGCVVSTKSDLFCVSEFKNLGIAGPLPVMKGSTDLDTTLLTQMILLRKTEDAVFKAEIADEIRRATSGYKINPNSTVSEQKQEFYKHMSSIERWRGLGKKDTK